jgi:ABC-2 type transport system ATP-binding protein
METAIEVRDLVIDRGKRRVLHGMNCLIPAGSVTGLLGPSGSGKTTLMRAIVGVQVMKSGQVTVLGIPAGSASLRRQIGYLTQAPSIYPDLTVRENAHYFASLYKGVTAADADSIIEGVGLGAWVR